MQAKNSDVQVYVYKLYRMIAEKNHLSPYLARSHVLHGTGANVTEA